MGLHYISLSGLPHSALKELFIQAFRVWTLEGFLGEIPGIQRLVC